jgi:acetyl-CoA C-acetyltransferase
MTDRVGIIGIGETDYRPVDDRSLEEMVHAASRNSLADAGLERDDIENVVACASDLEDGRAISSMVAAGPAGSYRRDFIKTTDTGVHALAMAAMRIRAGAFETALVVSWAKQSETDEETIRPLEGDPFYRRGTGLGHLTGHAPVAATYADRHSEADEAADKIVEKNTRNGVDSPSGHRPTVIDAAEAGDSPVISWPLRDAHLPDPSDGACVLVVAAEDVATEAVTDPVWIHGVGWETDSYNAGKRQAGELPALAGAAERAYDEGGVDTTDVDLVEAQTVSAYHELLACEALGLCDGAAKNALDGWFDRDGEVPVNPSGGPFAANPLIATGLARVAAAARQLRCEAGDVQVKGADTALAHAAAGFTDQVHGVAVLGGDGT